MEINDIIKQFNLQQLNGCPDTYRVAKSKLFGVQTALTMMLSGKGIRIEEDKGRVRVHLHKQLGVKDKDATIPRFDALVLYQRIDGAYILRRDHL